MTKPTKNIFNMVKLEWPQRAKALASQLTFEAADRTRQQVKKRIRSGDENSKYKKSIYTSKVTKLEKGAAGHIVRSIPRKGPSRENMNIKSTLAYVKSKTKVPSKRIAMLSKLNPLALDAMPETIKGSNISYKKASPAQVQKARRSNRAGMGRVPGLSKKSHASPAILNNIMRKSRNRAVTKMTVHALREEFINGHAAWRPAILGVTRRYIPSLAKKKTDFDRALADPKFRDWMHWPNKTSSNVASSDLESFAPFQDKVRVGVPK